MRNFSSSVYFTQNKFIEQKISRKLYEQNTSAQVVFGKNTSQIKHALKKVDNYVQKFLFLEMISSAHFRELQLSNWMSVDE